jgi:hypothetical protein
MKHSWNQNLIQIFNHFIFSLGRQTGGLFKRAHFGLLFVGLVGLLIYANTWHNDVTWVDATQNLWGQKPAYFHWINSLIFAYSVTLIWAIVFNLTGQKLELFPLLTALIFAVHPIHASVVASISSRMFLASFLLGLIACIKLLAFAKTKRTLYLITSTLAIGLAFICHESALAMIGIAPIFLKLYLRKSTVPAWEQSDTKKSIIAWTLIILIGIMVHLALGAEWTLTSPRQLWTDLPMALDMIGRYSWITFYPRHMIINYGPRQIPLIAWDTGSFRIMATVIGLTTLIVITKISQRYRPWLATGICLWIVPTIILSLGSLLFGFPMSETLAMIPSLGMSWIITWGILSVWDMCGRIPRPFLRYLSGVIWLWSVLLMIGVLGWITINRNAAWKNTLTLCARVAPYMSQNATFHLMFGETLLEGIPKESEPEIKEKLLSLAAGEMLMAIKLDPNLGTPYFRLGQIYEEFHSTESARWAYKNALEKDKKNTRYILQKLIILAESQGDTKAKERYKKVSEF